MPAKPGGQTLPQPPQLLASFCSLTQAFEQRDVPPLQVYPHTPPRQTAVALTTPVVHAVAVPHWPFELHVCTSLLSAHCDEPGLHTPEHCPLTQTYVHDATGLHVPPEHVCTPLPEHCVVPGVHDPAQLPELQTYRQASRCSARCPCCRRPRLLAGGAGRAGARAARRAADVGHDEPLFCQVPLPSQVCGCWPVQRVAPGVQVPMHAPDTHAWLTQVPGELQVPVPEHVSTPLLTHCTAPGVHDPVHAPETHAWLRQVVGLLQVPPFEQVSTPLLAHCWAAGEHATHAPLRHTSVEPLHAVAVPQLPVASQVFTSDPSAHWVAPGVQTPEHCVPLHT